jgi:4,5-dihydroxyphthalate decarboxylase
MDSEIKLSVMSSLLTRPILDGEVKPKGLKIQAREAESMDHLSRSMLNLEFDVGEMAISTFTKARELGVPLVGLPLFTSGRRFLQAGFQVSKRSGIQDLSDLRGRRAGMAQYWMSSSVWQRKILHDLYGVTPDEIQWVTVQPERLKELTFPSGVKVKQDTSGRNARELLQANEIDAILTPGGGRDGSSSGEILPAFPDNSTAQRDYYQKTGIFPIMHVTVIKEELAREKPWIVESLCNAYDEAKKLARSREVARSSDSPKAGETTKEMKQLMGDDPWPYGLKANRKPLETFVQAAAEQHLVGRTLKVEELFSAQLPLSHQ